MRLEIPLEKGDPSQSGDLTGRRSDTYTRRCWRKLNTITEGTMASQSTHAQLAAIQESLKQLEKHVREISVVVKAKKK